MTTTRTQSARASIEDILLLWWDTEWDGDYLVRNTEWDYIVYWDYTNRTIRTPQDV